MLLAIRDRATGWIAWIIVILLIIPFALWGIQEYLGGGSEPVVAEVNGVEITRNELAEHTERLLRSRDERPEGEAARAFRQRVLESMISQQALVDAARDQGMRIPAAQVDATLRNAPAFQADGKFSQQAYLRALSTVRMTPEQFWAQQRRELLREQLLQGVGGSAFATDYDLDEFIRLRDRRLDVSYGVLQLADFGDQVSVTEEEMRDFHQQNAQLFMVPPRVKLDYLKLDIADLEASVPVTEEQLRAMFEERKSSLFQPEQRAAAHILVAVPKDADEQTVEAARKRALEIRRRIEQGEAFAALAREVSDDAASAAQGGDIGTVAPGSRDLEFELALAELAEGEVSQPVRTPEGFEIVKLVERTPAHRPGFADVREQLAADYRRQQAEELFYQRSETLFDLTYENPLSLNVAADALGLDVQHTDWITPQGTATGLGSHPEVVSAAFSDDVLADGKLGDAVNSKLIELTGDDDARVNPVVVVRVAEYQPTRLQPREEVSGQIRTTLQRQKAQELAQRKAEGLIEELRQGGAFENVVGPAAGVLKKDVTIARNDTAHPAALVSAAFSLGKPTAEQPGYGTAVLDSGDVAVFAVTGMQEGDPAHLSEQERQSVRQLVARLQGLTEAQALVESVRQRADVDIDREALAQDQN